MAQVVVPAPVWIHLFRDKRVESIEHRQMVTVWVDELSFGSIGLCLLLSWSQEYVGYAHQGHDREDFVDATVCL